MQQKDIEALLQKYSAGTATPEERALVEAWYAQLDTQQTASEERLQVIEDEVYSRLPQPETVRVRRMWPRIAAAASIVIACSVGAYFILHKQLPVQVAQNDPEQLAPLQNGVTLTLANGQKLNLQKKHNGALLQTGNLSVTQQDSLLSYSGRATDQDVKMNTLANNSSSKFTVTLSDGTEATLDIGSSLTYPEVFKKADRLVTMTGQAYFKVKHQAGKRFMVKIKDQLTEDIATEFNINGYDDEQVIRTTLLEGSIKVNDRLLKPRQQAEVSGADLAVKTADIESVTAWLQNKLIFDQEPLENIMQRVARIYGVQVVYQDEEVKKYTYFGSVNYTKKLSSVLNFFRKAGRVDFSVEGKTVKVFKAKKKTTN